MFALIKSVAGAAVSLVKGEDSHHSHSSPVEALAAAWEAAQAEHARVAAAAAAGAAAPGDTTALNASAIPSHLDALVHALHREAEADARQAAAARVRAEVRHAGAGAGTGGGVTTTGGDDAFRISECTVFLLEQHVVERLCGMGRDDRPGGMMAIVLLTLNEIVALNPYVLLPSEPVHRAIQQLAAACVRSRREGTAGRNSSVSAAAAVSLPPVVPAAAVAATAAAAAAAAAERSRRAGAVTAVGKRGGMSSETATPAVSDDEAEARGSSSEGGGSASRPRVSCASALEEQDGGSEGGVPAAAESSQLHTVKYLRATPAQRQLAVLAHTIWCAVAQTPSLLSCFYNEMHTTASRVVTELYLLDAVSPWVFAEGSRTARPAFSDVSRAAVLTAFGLRDPRVTHYIIYKTGLVTQLALRAADAVTKVTAAMTRGSSPTPVRPSLSPPVSEAASPRLLPPEAHAVAVDRLAFINALLLVSAPPRNHLAAPPDAPATPAVAGGASCTGAAPDVLLAATLQHAVSGTLCAQVLEPSLAAPSATRSEAVMLALASLLQSLAARAPPLSASDVAAPLPLARMMECAVLGVPPPSPYYVPGAPLASCYTSTAARDALLARLSPTAPAAATRATYQLLTALVDLPASATLSHLVLAPIAALPGMRARGGAMAATGDLGCTPGGPGAPDASQLADGVSLPLATPACFWRALHRAALAGCRRGVRAVGRSGSSGSIRGSSGDGPAVSVSEWVAAAEAAAASQPAFSSHGSRGGVAASTTSSADTLVQSHGWLGFDFHSHTPGTAAYVTEAARTFMVRAIVPPAAPLPAPPPPPSSSSAPPPAWVDALISNLYGALDGRLDADSFALLTGLLSSLCRVPDLPLFAYLFALHDASDADADAAVATAAADAEPWTSLLDAVLDLWCTFHERLAAAAGSVSAACEAVAAVKVAMGVTPPPATPTSARRTASSSQPPPAPPLSPDAAALVAASHGLLEGYIRCQEFVRDLAATLEAAAGLGIVYT